jgi:hypothetical protein
MQDLEHVGSVRPGTAFSNGTTVDARSTRPGGRIVAVALNWFEQNMFRFKGKMAFSQNQSGLRFQTPYLLCRFIDASNQHIKDNMQVSIACEP